MLCDSHRWQCSTCPKSQTIHAGKQTQTFPRYSRVRAFTHGQVSLLVRSREWGVIIHRARRSRTGRRPQILITFHDQTIRRIFARSGRLSPSAKYHDVFGESHQGRWDKLEKATVEPHYEDDRGANMLSFGIQMCVRLVVQRKTVTDNITTTTSNLHGLKS